MHVWPLWPFPPQEDEQFDLESLLIPLDDVTMKEPPAKQERPDRKARSKKDALTKETQRRAQEKDNDKALETVRGVFAALIPDSFICSRRLIALHTRCPISVYVLTAVVRAVGLL